MVTKHSTYYLIADRQRRAMYQFLLTSFIFTFSTISLIAQNNVNIERNDFLYVCKDIATQKFIKKKFNNVYFQDIPSVCFDFRGYTFNQKEIILLNQEYACNNRLKKLTTLEDFFFWSLKTPTIYLKPVYIDFDNNLLICVFALFNNNKKQYIFCKYVKNDKDNWKRDRIKILK